MSNTKIENFNNDIPISVSIAPWLSVEDSVKAVDFYKTAFGAIEVYRLEAPDGGPVVKLSVDAAEFWLSNKSSDDGSLSSEALCVGSVRKF